MPRAINHETMWRQQQQLVERLFSVLESVSDERIDDCLDMLVDFLDADRGLIVLSHADGSTRVVNARAQKRTLTPVEREEISKTIVRDALQTGRCIVFDPMAVTNASSSIMSLGIRLALAAPFTPPRASRSGRRGVLYVDFRDPQKSISEHHVEFFISASLLVGAVLEQEDRFDSTRDHLREAQSRCVESRSAPLLSDLLASESLRATRTEVESSITGNSSIFIMGESGTGKTILAQAIAEASGKRPIVRAVLGGSDDLNTITSELFGHERGSFSGAAGRRIGIVEYAEGGTLILDEVLNLPVHAQKLLLDFTQFGVYRPLGYDRSEPKRASVRIIAATNGDIRSAVKDGRFRLDLFYRLAAVTLELPPLRHRREDIPALAEGFLSRMDASRRWAVSVPLRRLLLSPAIEWAGNVRQLEGVIGRARERALARDPEATTLTPEHIEATDLGGTPVSEASREPGAAASTPEEPGVTWQRLQAQRSKIDEAELAVIRQALSGANGVVARAARDLGIARTTLASRIDALELRPLRRSDA